MNPHPHPDPHRDFFLDPHPHPHFFDADPQHWKKYGTVTRTCKYY
jgi:hypothetical protein